MPSSRGAEAPCCSGNQRDNQSASPKQSARTWIAKTRSRSLDSAEPNRTKLPEASLPSRVSPSDRVALIRRPPNWAWASRHAKIRDFRECAPDRSRSARVANIVRHDRHGNPSQIIKGRTETFNAVASAADVTGIPARCDSSQETSSSGSIYQIAVWRSVRRGLDAISAVPRSVEFGGRCEQIDG